MGANKDVGGCCGALGYQVGPPNGERNGQIVNCYIVKGAYFSGAETAFLATKSILGPFQSAIYYPYCS